jgi:hypothetical protein
MKLETGQYYEARRRLEALPGDFQEALRHRTVRGVFRESTPLDRVSLCGCCSFGAAIVFHLPLSLIFLAPSRLVGRLVFPRHCPGGTLVILRRGSDVDSEMPFVCRLI